MNAKKEIRKTRKVRDKNPKWPSPAPEKIKQVRLQRGERQKDAALSVGKTERSWQNWEQGLRPMDGTIWILYLNGGLQKLQRKKPATRRY